MKDDSAGLKKSRSEVDVSARLRDLGRVDDVEEEPENEYDGANAGREVSASIVRHVKQGEG